ncbi:beta strand repeat-containing protein [Clostridium sp. LBM24168]
MNNSKKLLSVLSTAAVSAIIASVISTPASAKMASVVLKDASGKLYEYNYQALTDSFVNGTKLYDDFKALKDSGAQVLSYYDDVQNEFVSRSTLIDAYLNDTTGTFNAKTATETLPTTAVDGTIYEKVENPDGTVSEQPKQGTADVEVSSVSAVNATTVEAGGVPTTVEEADLKDKKVTLKTGDVSLTATYVEGSLTAEGKANFLIDEGKKLTDAAEYTVTSDWASFTTSKFVAKVSPQYIKSVEAVTTGIAAKDTTESTGTRTISFEAKDQYGEDVELNATNTANLKITGTKNGIPYLTSEIGYIPGEDNFTIPNTVVEGDKIAFTFTNKDADGNVLGTSTVNYTVTKAEAVKATSIEAIKASYNKPVNNHQTTDDVTEVMPDDEITLTADVKDQFGNPFSTPKVRWVVTEGQKLIAADPDTDNTQSADLVNATKDYTVDSTVDNGTDANHNAISFKANAAGTVTITAYSLDNAASKSWTVQIGAKKLTNIDAVTFTTPYNKEANKSAVVTYTEGAALTPDILKFKVTSLPAGAAESDITFSAAYGTTEATKNNIYITATTQKEGTYKFKAYVGESFDKATVVGAESTIATTKNPAPVSIEVPAFAANELPANSEVKKDVTFKNKNGETISVNAKDLVVTGTTGITVNAYDKDGNALTIGTDTAPVAKLGFTASAAGSYTVNLVSGAANARLDIVASDTAQISSIELAQSSVSVITADSKDAATPSDKDLVAIKGGVAYKLIPVTFKDQYGNATSVKANQFDLTVTGTDSNTKPDVELWDGTADDTADLTASDDKDIKYIAVKAGTGDTTQVLTLQAKVRDGGANVGAPATLTVNVQAERALNSLSVEPADSKLVAGAAQEFTVKGVDQYGETINLDGAKLKLAAPENGEYKLIDAVGSDATTGTDSDDNGIVRIKAVTPGTYTAVVYYDSNDNNKDASDKTVSIPLTIQEVGDAINSISIDPTVVADVNTEDYNGKYDVSKNKLYVESGQDSNKYTFNVKALDADGNNVGLDQESVIYSVVSSDIINQTDPDAKVTVTTENFDKNVLTINTDGTNIGDQLTGSVTIKASTLNGKTATITLNVDSKAGEAQTGTYYFSNIKDGKDASDPTKVLPALTSVDLTEDDTPDLTTDGSREIYLIAVDQYGKLVNADENASAIVIGSDSSSYFDKSIGGTDNGIDESVKLTAKAVGTSTLRVFANGNQEATLTITANQDAVDAAKAASAATKAEAKTNAEAKIDAIPNADSIDHAGLSAAQTAVNEANTAVNDAKAAGWTQTEVEAFTGYAKIAEAETAIADQTAVDTAVTTLADGSVTITDAAAQPTVTLNTPAEADGSIAYTFTAKTDDNATVTINNPATTATVTRNATAGNPTITVTATKNGKTATQVYVITVPAGADSTEAVTIAKQI